MHPTIGQGITIVFMMSLLASESNCANSPKKKDPVFQSKFTSVFTIPGLGTKIQNNDKELLTEINAISELCEKNSMFLDLRPNHKKAQYRLMTIFRAKENTEDFLNLAKRLQLHPKLNYQLWLRAFLAVSAERPELVGLDLPILLQLTPENFVNTEPIAEAKKGRAMSGECIHLDGRYTAENDNEEQLLWYFREDLSINIRHYQWHIQFDYNSTMYIYRRGESFGYFHQNLLARYHAERLANGLRRTKPLAIEEGAIIEEGYNPHLGDPNEFQEKYGYRLPNTTITNYTGLIETYNTILKDLEAHAFVKSDGTTVTTTNSSAIDVMGDLVEGSTTFSINPERYLEYGLHNDGHDLIANLSLEGVGIMSTTGTAVRDPVFYRWHTLIDDLLVQMRLDLPPYHPTDGELPLSWSTVTLKNLAVESDESDKTESESSEERISLKKNELQTFFRNVTISLQHTTTSVLRGELINYCIHTLDHRHFKYQIEIISTARISTRATIRIFMAPRFDEEGNRFSMIEQKRFFFPMDSFGVKLRKGLNRIVRHSKDSLLTIQTNYDGSVQSDVRQCQCGWPSHMLLPRGTTEGMVFDLFAMVTDREFDQPLAIQREPPACLSAHILCGSSGSGEEYPDRRPMGYPFDRQPFVIEKDGEQRMVDTLDEFVEPNSNMKTIQVKIIHSTKESKESGEDESSPSNPYDNIPTEEPPSEDGTTEDTISDDTLPEDPSL